MKTKPITDQRELQAEAQTGPFEAGRSGHKPCRPTAKEILHLKLFLRHRCPKCSESMVADEVRQLNHVRRVQAHPGQHEIEIWTVYPAQGLMREIAGVLRFFCCEMTACRVR